MSDPDLLTLAHRDCFLFTVVALTFEPFTLNEYSWFPSYSLGKSVFRIIDKLTALPFLKHTILFGEYIGNRASSMDTRP